AGGEQGPEQHCCGVRRWQHGLRLDPSLELLAQPLDGVRCACALPLARWQSREGEEPVAGFLQAVGHRTMLEPPFADEGLATRLDLLARRRVDHVVIVGGDLLMQAFGRMRQQVAVLVDRAALYWHAIPYDGDRSLKPWCAIDNEELGPLQPTPDEIVEHGTPGFGALA